MPNPFRFAVQIANLPQDSWPERVRAYERLGYSTVFCPDHFGPQWDPTVLLAAAAAVTTKLNVGSLVYDVDYRHPVIHAKGAATIQFLSGGRHEFGIGAGWHEDEHRGYGIGFPSPATRVEMLDEALTVIRRLWTEDSVSHEGRFFTLEDALCNPKPLQRPCQPIVIGGLKPKMLRVIARHAIIDLAARALEMDPAEIRRSVQLFLHPQQREQVDKELATLAEYEQAGCQHVVLSFYQPPDTALLERCAALT